MAFCGGTNVMLVDIVGVYLGEDVENTLQVRKASAWSAATIQETLDDIAMWYVNEVLPWQNAAYTMGNVFGRDITTDIGLVGESVAGFGEVGQRGGASLPGNVSVVIKFGTGYAGRARRGRNYAIALAEPDVTDNIVSSTVVAGLQSAYEALNANLAPNGCEHVVFSRTGCDPETPGTSTVVTPVIAYTVNNHVRTQRRRLAR